MLRKIFTYGLILTLLVSITGISVTWHICKTLNVVNTEKCEMEDMTSHKMPSNCCENDDATETISNYLPVCCEYEVVENKISDQFLFDNYELTKNNHSSVILIGSSDGLTSNPITKSVSEIHNTSPPHLDNHIYLHNSILLI